MVLSFCRLAAARSPLKLLQQQAWRAATPASGAQFFCSTSGSDPTKTDPAIERLFIQNRAWVAKVNEEDPTYFPKLGSGQAPEYLYIGCSDSRVSITSLTGLQMGEVFVHRNVANLVVSTDLNLLAVMTYAVEHLKVKHILVTGHYDCGGIRAAMKPKDIGPVLDAWVCNIRDVYRLHQDELDAVADPEERHRRLVELNVAEQCLNIYKTSIVQKKRLETHNDPDAPFSYPRVHGLVFDPATGIVNKVPNDYRRTVKELTDLYDLFDEKDFKVPKQYLVKAPAKKKK
jgi:carbonic anhydrase